MVGTSKSGKIRIVKSGIIIRSKVCIPFLFCHGKQNISNPIIRNATLANPNSLVHSLSV